MPSNISVNLQMEEQRYRVRKQLQAKIIEDSVPDQALYVGSFYPSLGHYSSTQPPSPVLQSTHHLSAHSSSLFKRGN